MVLVQTISADTGTSLCKGFFPFSCTSFIRKRTAKKSHGFRNTRGEKYFFSPLEDAVFQENLNAQGLHCGECSQDTFWRLLIKSFLALSFMIAAFCFISYLWGPMLSSGHLLATIYWKLLLFRGEKERGSKRGGLNYTLIFSWQEKHTVIKVFQYKFMILVEKSQCKMSFCIYMHISTADKQRISNCGCVW